MRRLMNSRMAALAWTALPALACLALHAASALAQTVPAARALLPDTTKAGGVLRVATSLQWPPFAYTDNGGPDGIDIRLVKLLAGKLGLTAQFDDIKFPSIVPGVAAGRYDVGVDQIGDTPERAKAVAFVDYYNSGYGLLVRKGSETAFDLADLCGRTLALTQGSAQVGIADTLSAGCVQAGKPAIAKLMFPDSADTYLAVANGRGDGFLTDRAVGVYIARTNPKLGMAEGSLPALSTLSGIVVAKANKPLEDALREALRNAQADGSYQHIFADYGVPDGVLTAEQIGHGVQP